MGIGLHTPMASQICTKLGHPNLSPMDCRMFKSRLYYLLHSHKKLCTADYQW